jgi:PAS domain S-box-containing protein
MGAMDTVSNKTEEVAIESLRLELQRLRRALDESLVAIDTIPGMISIGLPDGHICFLNQRWRDYTGLSLAEGDGRGLAAAIHPEDMPGAESHWRSLIASGKPGEVELRIRRFDGVYRWFLNRTVPIYDSAGGLIKWYAQSTDIDDIKRIEGRLRHSEAFFTEAQRLSLTGSLGWNVGTGELHWSAETFFILGYESSAKPTLDLLLQRVHPDDRDQVRTTLDRARRAQADLDFEHRLVLPDGTIKHVHVMARAARSAADNVEFVGAVMDVTQRVRATEALHASEHLARGQLETLASTLTALSRESKPENFLKHVLRTICEQLGAHSVGVWELNDATGNVELVANYADDRLHLPTPEQMQAKPEIQIARMEHPVWSEFFRGAIDVVYGDIDPEPPWVRIAKDPRGPWYDDFGRNAVNPLDSTMLERLFERGIVSTICIPMLVAGNVTGFFHIRFKEKHYFRQEEVELTQAMAHQATLALRLMRLSQQSREAAVAEERNRMARDIHDTLAQGFTGVIVQLEAVKGAVARFDFADIDTRIERTSQFAKSILQEARRSVLALRPHSLQGGTLRAVLDVLLRRMADGTSLHAELRVSGEERAIPMDWEENLLRIAQEALTNTIKYAQALTFRALLTYGLKEVQLLLTDDGRGFDTEAQHEGLGLIGMKERADRMAGRIVICSTRGGGTEIRVILDNPASHQVE